MTVIAPTSAPAATPIRFMWLELTGFCNLSCTHCYASSSPNGSHGSMSEADWRRVLDQAVAGGIESVCFIGGEPTLHPVFAELVEHALDIGLDVEVYTNLVHVNERLWALFGRGVRIATSYYSDDPGQHDAITARRGSHARTRNSIAEAIRRGVDIRVSIIDYGDGQRVEAARSELRALGVPAHRIGVDRVRRLGRAAADRPTDAAELCGGCGNGRLAVGPDGQVWPCPLSRWLPCGDVHQRSLDEVLASSSWRVATAAIPRHAYPELTMCRPDPTECRPGDCRPKSDGTDCSPAENPTCRPSFR